MRHPTKPMFEPWGREFVEVDVAMVPLIRALWGCGIRTATCCQGVPLRASATHWGRGEHWCSIEFTEMALMERFLTLAATGEDDPTDLESIRNRIAPVLEPDDWRAFRERREWQYNVGVIDVGADDGLDDDENPSYLPSGPEVRTWLFGVRFPIADLPEVTRRLELAASEIAGERPWTGR